MLDSDRFCPECGHPNGSPVTGSAMPVENKRESLLTIAVLDAVWVLIALICGLEVLLNGAELIAAMKADPGIWDIVAPLFSEAQILQMFGVMGAVFIVSGISAAVSAALTVKGRHYKIAMASLLIAAVTGTAFAVGIVGFVIAFLLSKAKNCFTD